MTFTRSNDMTSVEVNIDDWVAESSAFVVFGVVAYLPIKVDI